MKTPINELCHDIRNASMKWARTRRKLLESCKEVVLLVKEHDADMQRIEDALNAYCERIAQ